MPETKRSAPASVRSAERRRQIREAAKECFLRSGFQAVSMESIREVAGVSSKETIYRYYPSKEGLFLDVIRSRTVEGPFLGKVLSETPEISAVQELRSFLKQTISEHFGAMLQPDYLAVMRVLMSELPRLPALGSMFRQTVPARATAQIKKSSNPRSATEWFLRPRTRRPSHD